MHNCSHRVLLVFLLAGLAGVMFPAAPSAAGVTQRLHYSFDGVPGMTINGPGIPGNCSTWHELYPTFCAPAHQDAYEDNGDGVISPCDNIFLNGVRYHVVWVGPTYHMSRVSPTPSEPLVAEPVQPQPGENPVCEVWHEVYPNYCREFHVDSWQDANGNGVLDVCDVIDIQPPQVPVPSFYHIDRITLDIIVEIDPTGTRRSTWGEIKTLYRN